MKNFLTKSLSKLLLSKVFLLLVLFFGGCEVALVPSAYLQYLLGDRQGVVTVDDISIINGGTPTMYFTVNSEATSATVYTLDSTNTLAFVEGAYNSHYDGAYTYAIYEGSNTKLWLANFDLKSGIYKLYSNGVVIDEGNFVWWVGDIDLEPTSAPDILAKKTILVDSFYVEGLSHIVISDDASEAYSYLTRAGGSSFTFELQQGYTEDYALYCGTQDFEGMGIELHDVTKDGGNIILVSGGVLTEKIPFIYATTSGYDLASLIGKSTTFNTGSATITATFGDNKVTLSSTSFDSVELAMEDNTGYVVTYYTSGITDKYTIYFPTTGGGTHHYEYASDIYIGTFTFD